MKNIDLKNYRAMDDKAKFGEVVAMVVAIMAFLFLLSWLTERETYGMSETAQIAERANYECSSVD